MLRPDVSGEPLPAPADAPPLQEVALPEPPDPRVKVLQSAIATPTEQENAFSEIMEGYQAGLVNFAASRVGPSDAEDAVQITFINAFRAMERFENNGEKALKGWLYMIAKRVTLNMIRSAGSRPSFCEIKGQGPAVMDDPGARLEFEQTLALLDEVPERQRTAMIRRADDCSYEEIAELEGTTVPGVKSLLVRGRHNFGQLLIERGLREESETHAKAAA